MSSSPRGPSLDDYGLIGNLHTAALVSRYGSVDWACFPRFSSPSVFARILDEHRGGFHSVVPEGRYSSVQGYRPSSAVLETRFELASHRRLVVTDLMPILHEAGPEGSPMILRDVRAVGGPVTVTTTFAPRFDYGRRPPSLKTTEQGCVATAGPDALRYRHPGELTFANGTATARVRIEPDRPLELEIGWGQERPVPFPFGHLVERTDRFWRRWTHAPTSPIHLHSLPWHTWVERSELTLKLLSHSDTGAFVAAPTTSLPEWPGGARNWDYRFVWVRDAAFSAQAMIELGHLAEARSFLRWAIARLKAQRGHRLRVVYGAHGETDLTERTLPHLSGLWGSRPVRIGNGAAEQFQLDIYGELLNAALVLDRVDPTYVDAYWTELTAVADQVVRLWRRPDRGIWEVRGPPRQYVHSKLMAWVALDRASRLSHPRNVDGRRGVWEHEAERIRDWILTHGYDPASKSFRQAEDQPAPDAANLRIPLVGFLPFDDPRVTGTVDRILHELSVGPFVYRYRAPDGLAGDEGAFLPTSFWLVECLARIGRTREAHARWRGLLGAGTSLGLFSEEYDPKRRLRLGNFPQALTHIGLLRAARALGEMPALANGEESGRASRSSTGRRASAAAKGR